MSEAPAVLDDLREESEELDRLVAELPPGAWATPTPAPGWTVAHQIAHLAWTDEAALLAATDPGAFATAAERAAAAPDRFVDEGAEAGATAAPDALLARWREGRARLHRVLAEAPAGSRFPWYGPPMSATSLATARLMETWAHGQDVADALGVARPPTARLRHVAWLGVRARDYAYAVRGLPAPPGPFRVELRAPDGRETWAYGPEDAPQRVTGPALDFCLLVTQRVHRDDTALRAEGAEADHWLTVAQAFAGPPGPGRAPAAGSAPSAGRAPATGPSPVTGPSPSAGRPPGTGRAGAGGRGGA
ncbi:TIGR03084 family metal-binding protein [Streptomyces sp. LP05-1]|uniref:TIGR03084 family metal-binding protein n=1 Tax=Streptomyces pyxinae TaxID=2970734 RepID=A0ABT2CET0_9ACTN|nr:TIGR03084 family metal-binding protein [Streptomyces sp. LP05-1]MCS0635920.1 TIGR03084 family metal-binding protein [Streptomyces sp. LP05-1]